MVIISGLGNSSVFIDEKQPKVRRVAQCTTVWERSLPLPLVLQGSARSPALHKRSLPKSPTAFRVPAHSLLEHTATRLRSLHRVNKQLPCRASTHTERDSTQSPCRGGAGLTAVHLPSLHKVPPCTMRRKQLLCPWTLCGFRVAARALSGVPEPRGSPEASSSSARSVQRRVVGGTEGTQGCAGGRGKERCRPDCCGGRVER
jgi:hypothetical protein